ncbi:MAG: glycosyltransferase family 4 protein [Microbacteriaceae bacterium]|nr:glycosyltransferase family 4 protein [Microbacteriaceae bacterium]
MTAKPARDPGAHRIALVIDYALDYLGGAQNAFWDGAHALKNAGHSITIVAPDTAKTRKTAELQKWQRAGGGVLLVKTRGTVPGVGLPIVPNTSKLRARLNELYKTQGITAVHLHSEFGLANAALQAAQAQNLPVAHTVHTFFWEARLPKVLDWVVAALLRRGLGWLIGAKISGFAVTGKPLASARTDSVLRGATLQTVLAADAVISPSAHQAEILREAAQRAIAVVPNPQHSAAETKPDTEAELAVMPDFAQGLRLVWIGRLVPEKRLIEFIKACKLVQEQAPNLRFQVAIVGAGPLEAQARAQAKGLPIKFLGRLEREQVLAQISAAHVTVLSSNGFDNQPVTIVESVQQGRPVLLCDRRLPEGLHGGSGIYTAGPAPQDFAREIIRLANDPAAVQKAAAATAQDRADFCPVTHVARLLKVYETASQV